MFLTSSSSNPLVSGVLENRLDFDVFVLSSQGNTGGLGAIGGYNGRRLVSKTGGQCGGGMVWIGGLFWGVWGNTRTGTFDGMLVGLLGGLCGLPCGFWGGVDGCRLLTTGSLSGLGLFFGFDGDLALDQMFSVGLGTLLMGFELLLVLFGGFAGFEVPVLDGLVLQLLFEVGMVVLEDLFVSGGEPPVDGFGGLA